MAAPATATRPSTQYRIRATSVEACNCNHGCNCQFAGFPNDGKCEFIIGFKVEEGRFGDVDMAGVRAAIAAKYPNAIHQGHGYVVLFVDESASQEQVNAFASILSGQLGGMPWEALAGTVERFDGPISKPVEIEVEGRNARVSVPGAVELVTTSLLNPVTGAENDVHIVYPSGGFFWNDGTIVTTSTMRVDFQDMKMEWPGRFSSISEVNWTNQN